MRQFRCVGGFEGACVGVVPIGFGFELVGMCGNCRGIVKEKEELDNEKEKERKREEM